MRTFDDDRLPPHALRAEQSLLASLLIDREAILRIAPYVDESDFSRDSHRAIYAAALSLTAQHVPVDLVTLVEELRMRERLDDVGGESYLAELVASEVTAVHANYYASIVRDASTRRRLIDAAREAVIAAYDERLPLSDVLARVDEVIATVTRDRSRRTFQSTEDIMTELYVQLDKHADPAINLGIPDVNALVGGVTRGSLVLLAARPGLGKSSMALQLAHGMARRDSHVGIVSLEMTNEELARRLIALSVDVDMSATGRGVVLPRERYADVTHAMGSLSTLPLYLDDASDGSLVDVIARARAMVSRVGLDVLIVDYVQLMHNARGTRRTENRVQEVGSISRALKTFAREANVVVIALSQLSRASEKRSDPTPILSDLRESGDLEQDADIVAFIHRPDLYDASATPMLAQIIVAKHRMGPVGMTTMRFDARRTRFVSPGV